MCLIARILNLEDYDCHYFRTFSIANDRDILKQLVVVPSEVVIKISTQMK